MGYMTTITILNDAFDQIENNPKQFIENIKKGIDGERISFIENNKINHKKSYCNSYPVGNYCNPMEVAMSNHASESRLYLVGENMMTILGDLNDIKDIEVRKKLLEEAKSIIQREENIIRKIENK